MSTDMNSRGIYGNKAALQSISSMFKSGRMPHSFLLYGEKGTGKKLIADYFAAAILCENNHDGEPCGECHSCRLAKSKAHPDIIYPEKSGKLMTYTVETCRNVCADSIVSPNNGAAKVYIFTDCDNLGLSAQNALLKVVEEPPLHVYFIFTSVHKDSFLPTIISRVTSIGTAPCTADECKAALAESGYNDEDIKGAVSAFGGNIGMCREYIVGDELKGITALTRAAIDSIINSDEYSLMKALSDPVLKDRKLSRQFLDLFDKTVRDAAVLRYRENAEMAGCSPRKAEQLSHRLSVKSAQRIHMLIGEAAKDISANVSSSLVMTALCGDIINS